MGKYWRSRPLVFRWFHLPTLRVAMSRLASVRPFRLLGPRSTRSCWGRIDAQRLGRLPARGPVVDPLLFSVAWHGWEMQQPEPEPDDSEPGSGHLPSVLALPGVGLGGALADHDLGADEAPPGSLHRRIPVAWLGSRDTHCHSGRTPRNRPMRTVGAIHAAPRATALSFGLRSQLPRNEMIGRVTRVPMAGPPSHGLRVQVVADQLNPSNGVGLVLGSYE